MSELNLDMLRKLCDSDSVVWSVHAMERLQERGIAKSDILNVILHGKIIEQYPNAFPNPACLISGETLNKTPLHVVIGADGVILTVITAYEPTTEKFENNLETRKEKES